MNSVRVLYKSGKREMERVIANMRTRESDSEHERDSEHEK